jgi:O-antigen/teichoic acid export membrane protein
MTLILINLSFLLAIIITSSFFNYNKLLPYKFDKQYFKNIWKYSWPQLIGFPGLYIINYIDLYVIKKYMTLHDVGIYSMAYTGFQTISSILMIFYTIFFPLIVEYKTKGQTNKINN